VNEYSRNRQELYNVRNDPEEKHDLSPDPAFAAIMSRAHLRLEAWLVFQNHYLDGFACSDCKTPRKGSEPIGLAQDDENPYRVPIESSEQTRPAKNPGCCLSHGPLLRGPLAWVIQE
jgi:hypothetical protein